MNTWKKIDIAGRAIVLIAVGFQLFALGALQSGRQRGDVYYIMENQAYIADMVRTLDRLNGPLSREEMIKAIDADYSHITLFSEWEKSSWNKAIGMSNIIFIFAFLAGGLISLLARFMELKEK